MRRLPPALAASAIFGLLLAGTLLPGRAGMTAIYVLAGVIPGIGLALTLRPAIRLGSAIVLGLALGPFATSLAGWGLYALGVPLRSGCWAVIAAGFALVLLGLLAARAPRVEAPELSLATPIRIGLLLVFIVITPPLFNPWISMRGDAWTHGGIIWQIVVRGLPPTEPRLACTASNYVWLFNLFIGMLTSVRLDPPFWFMSLFDAAVIFPTAVFAGALTWRLWKSPHATTAGVLLFATGMNAGAYLLRPLMLLRALVGRVRGWPDVKAFFTELHLGTASTIYDLAAPFAYMVSFLDKYLIGTGLGYAYLLMMLALWGALLWLEDGRGEGLVWALVGAAGTMFIHGVVGLSVIPVAIGACGLAVLLRFRAPWLPSHGRLLALLAAFALGGLVGTPSMRAAAGGWSAQRSGLHNSYLVLKWQTAWTILTALGIVLAFAWRPALEAWRRQRPGAAWMSLMLASMLAFALVVHLPEDNQVKFIFQTLVPAAALGAAAFADWGRNLWLAHRGRAIAVFAIVFAVPSLLTWQGFLCDPEGRTVRVLHPQPGDEPLYSWLRANTPDDGVIVDSKFNSMLMVTARRRLYLGTSFGPERSAFPLDQIVERRAVVADLYRDANDLDGALRSFDHLGAPTFVLFRTEEYPDSSNAPWKRLDAHGDRFAVVYATDDFRLYRVGAGH